MGLNKFSAETHTFKASQKKHLIWEKNIYKLHRKSVVQEGKNHTGTKKLRKKNTGCFRLHLFLDVLDGKIKLFWKISISTCPCVILRKLLLYVLRDADDEMVTCTYLGSLCLRVPGRWATRIARRCGMRPHGRRARRSGAVGGRRPSPGFWMGEVGGGQAPSPSHSKKYVRGCEGIWGGRCLVGGSSIPKGCGEGRGRGRGGRGALTWETMTLSCSAYRSRQPSLAVFWRRPSLPTEGEESGRGGPAGLGLQAFPGRKRLPGHYPSLWGNRGWGWASATFTHFDR